MRISDYNSLFTMNQLNRTTSAINRSLQRLSTGLRVNSPQDDPAAFSEGVNLDSAVRGYTQAILNINQAIALANTASSAISSQTEIVQKMRELAVQAANGTLSVQDRNNLNTGFQQLVLEFNRITSQTSFNGIQLLDGSFNTTSIQVGTKAGDTISFSTGNTLGSQIFQKTLGSGTFTPSSCGSLNLNFGGTHYLIAPIGFGSPLRDLVVDVNGDGIPDVISRAVTAVGYPSRVQVLSLWIRQNFLQRPKSIDSPFCATLKYLKTHSLSIDAMHLRKAVAVDSFNIPNFIFLMSVC